MQRRFRRGSASISVYKCPVCQQYHVGHTPKPEEPIDP
jgi:hypothetical protein